MNTINRIESARFLRERHRPQEALAVLMEELAQSPESSEIHCEVCLTYLELPGAKPEALKHVRQAISLAPDNAFVLALEGHVLNQMDKYKAAHAAAQRALQQDTECILALRVECFAYLGEQRWQKMEQTARMALTMYPDDAVLKNALGIALRYQGKLDEAGVIASMQLARSPDSASNLAQAGWLALHARRGDEAETLFLSALQRDAGSKYAIDGLREAYKSRSFIYRWYLAWCFAIARIPSSWRTFAFISIFLFGKILVGGLSSVHAVLGMIASALISTFIFWSHLANGISNALLLKDNKARMTLSRAERWDGFGTLIFLGTSVILMVTGFFMSSKLLALVGLLFLAILIPLGKIHNRTTPGRIVFSLFSLACFSMAILALCIRGEVGLGIAGVGMMLVFLSTWIGLVGMLNKPAQA